MHYKLLAAALAVLGSSGAAASGTGGGDNRTMALAALADIRTAVAEIVRIEDGYSVGRPTYARAAHRALNALLGRRDPGYDAKSGDAGDGTGALGHIDALLDRRDESRWTPAVAGAKANLLAAAVDLNDALDEKEMEEYEADLTRALANLSLAVGRPSQPGVLGGLSGALGTTTLGIPQGALSVSGCAAPSQVPAYGVVDGQLAYVALPRSTAAAGVPDELSVARVTVDGDRVMLYTPVAAASASRCRAAALPAYQVAALTTAQLGSPPAASPEAAGAASSGTASGGVLLPSFTLAQARRGAAVFATTCTPCHGANLQGVAGPAVAGTQFLTSAKGDEWTFEDVRTLVVQNMPLSNPGSLSPQQYADVLAFLLASNCFPAGSKALPLDDDPSFKQIKLAAPSGAKPDDAQLGTCKIK